MTQRLIILEWKCPFLQIFLRTWVSILKMFCIKLAAFSESPSPVHDWPILFSFPHSGAVNASTPTILCDQSGHWHLPSESLSTNCSRVISCSRKHRPNYSVAKRQVTVSTPCIIHQCWRQIISPDCLHPHKRCTEIDYLFGRPVHTIFYVHWICILFPNVNVTG